MSLKKSIFIENSRQDNYIQAKLIKADGRTDPKYEKASFLIL